MNGVMHDRHDLSDEQWARIEGLLPDRTPKRGGRWMDHRLVVNGVLWRTRAGAAWRDLPAGYGNWKTVYARHRRWAGDGTWRLVIDDLRADCDADDAVGEWGRGCGRDRDPGSSARGRGPASTARRHPRGGARAGRAGGRNQTRKGHRGIGRTTRISVGELNRSRTGRRSGAAGAD